ncbi:M3 family metallopeptidase [Microcoleus sp. S28C3]|uniref:M3 family metallopeptidase n=1 Tax=Microcoleus sp. S28C3 TaxID=3055414 RepID=UPI002FD3F8DB
MQQQQNFLNKPVEELRHILTAWIDRIYQLSEMKIYDGTLIEVTTIYNNIAYLFLYLEANEDFSTYDQLKDLRDIVHQDKDLDKRMLRGMKSFKSKHPQLEKSRIAYIEQLEDRICSKSFTESNIALEIAKTQFQESVEQLEKVSVDVLGKLGFGKTLSRHSEYSIINGIKDNQSRSKFIQYLKSCKLESAISAAEAFDNLVSARHFQARTAGFDSSLMQFMSKATVNLDEVNSYIYRNIQEAVKVSKKQADVIKQELSVEYFSLDHMGALIRRRNNSWKAPLFDLQECIEIARKAVVATFNADLKIEEKGGGDRFITLAVVDDGKVLGRIHLDLWTSDRKRVKQNFTIGLLNRTSINENFQAPEAYVCCRISKHQDGHSYLNFQNVHSLYHELGHALNHVFNQMCVSNLTGLEYLPLERLEVMSMWFEKLVFSHHFANGFSDIELNDIVRCQEVKKSEYTSTVLTKSLVAALDFECHKMPGIKIYEIFNAFVEKYGISKLIDFSDLISYFSWPSYMSYPGANFIYLLGASRSCEDAVKYGHSESGEYLFDCLNHDYKFRFPNVTSLYEFYADN